LLPKTQRNSMLPARWAMLPCRNIDTSAASQTSLSGSNGGDAGEPKPQALSSPKRNVATTSSTVRGSPVVSSQGMAAHRSVKSTASGVLDNGVGCKNRNTATQAAMITHVTTGTDRAGFSSRNGSTKLHATEGRGDRRRFGGTRGG